MAPKIVGTEKLPGTTTETTSARLSTATLLVILTGPEVERMFRLGEVCFRLNVLTSRNCAWTSNACALDMKSATIQTSYLTKKAFTTAL